MFGRGLGLGCLLLLAGCQNAAQSKTSIRFANWGGAGDDSEFSRLVKDIYAEFESENPDLKLRVEGIPGSQEYVNKLLLSFVADSEPDVITLDASSAAVFIDSGVLADLTPLIQADKSFKLSDYWENAVGISQRGGKTYAIPLDFTPIVMYYNRRMFREAGIPEPQAGWTYDEFLVAAKKLTKPGQYGFMFASRMPEWITWLWNNGGDVLNPKTHKAVGTLDSPQNVETLTYLREMINDHKVAPNVAEVTSGGVDYFNEGKAAMKVSGHWSLIGLADKSSKVPLEDVGIVALPTNLAQPVTVMYAAGYAIGKNSKHKEAAWKFIKFMTSHAVQVRYNASGVAICGRRDVAEAKNDQRLERVFNEIVPTARPPWGASVEGYAIVEDIGQRMMNAVLNQGKPIGQALKEAAIEIDRELESNRL